MKYLFPALLVVLISCSKSDKETTSLAVETKPEVCTSGNESFNLTKRALVIEPVYNDKKGGGRGGDNPPPPPPPPPPPTGTAVILLDVDGHTVSNTSWNTAGNFVCSPANLTAAEISGIVQRVQIDYSPFNIVVTTDESVYNNAPYNKRMRVILTETWEWFGQSGGTAFIGSFTWGNNTPCFVFTSLLNYNVKNISEATAHEAGHTLGLHHQSSYDGNCSKVNDYNYGIGAGETSWAPIMGCGYYKNLTLWHNGANSYGCNSFQNDINIINNVVGSKADDHGNAVSAATPLSGSLTGIINSTNDVDFFSVNVSGTRSIVLKPDNTGADNSAGNLDLLMKIYNSNGTLVQTISNPNTLDAAITLTAGTYYIAAQTESNSNSAVYGMVGSYTISVN